MAAPTPTVEEMFQQMLTFQQTMISSVQNLINGSTITNTRLDSLVESVQAIELAQSLTIYPNQMQPEGSNPMNSETHDADWKSRPSSPIPSDQGDKEPSVAEPGTSEEELRLSPRGTPLLEKCVEIHSMFAN